MFLINRCLVKFHSIFFFYLFRSYPLVHSRVDINRLKDTSYEVIISVLISDDDITTQSTLDCELKIPDTPYVKRKTFVFFQGRCIDLFFSSQIIRMLKTNRSNQESPTQYILIKIIIDIIIVAIVVITNTPLQYVIIVI